MSSCHCTTLHRGVDELVAICVHRWRPRLCSFIEFIDSQLRASVQVVRHPAIEKSSHETNGHE